MKKLQIPKKGIHSHKNEDFLKKSKQLFANIVLLEHFLHRQSEQHRGR